MEILDCARIEREQSEGLRKIRLACADAIKFLLLARKALVEPLSQDEQKEYDAYVHGETEL